MPFHRQFKPFGPQPIREQGQWPEFPKPPVWPRALLGKALEWRYVGEGGHAWLIRETGGGGFEFRVSGDRVWVEVGTTPNALGETRVAKVLSAAIGRPFLRSEIPVPNAETAIPLLRDDFVQAGEVAP